MVRSDAHLLVSGPGPSARVQHGGIGLWSALMSGPGPAPVSWSPAVPRTTGASSSSWRRFNDQDGRGSSLTRWSSRIGQWWRLAGGTAPDLLRLDGRARASSRRPGTARSRAGRRATHRRSGRDHASLALRPARDSPSGGRRDDAYPLAPQPLAGSTGRTISETCPPGEGACHLGSVQFPDR